MHSYIAFAARPGEHASCRFASAEDRRLLTVALVRDAARRGYEVLHLRPGDVKVAVRVHARLDAGYAGLTLTGAMSWAFSDLVAAQALNGRMPGAKPMLLCRYDHSTGRLGSVLDSHFHGPLSLDLDGLTYVDVAGMRALRERKGQPRTIHAAADRLKARRGSSARTTTTERSLATVEGTHAPERGGGRRRLTDAEERRLVLAAKEGDEPRRAELVEAFTPLIARAARAYRRSPSVDRRELMQEGVVGLLQALERYDPSLGTPFWAYASWWVRQAMQQIVAQLTRPMVLSDRALRQLARVRNAERDHLQKKGRAPSLPELAEATEIDVAHIECLACAERRPRALQEPLSGDDGGSDTFGDLLRDPTAEDAYDRVPQQLLASELAALLGELSDREQSILRGRFGIGGPERTLRELGGALGVSAERVRQIEQHALDKLRDAVGR